MKIKAVIVDDEKAGVEILKRALEKYCSEVMIVGTAKNAVEAKKIIDDEKPDLVFLDINMPKTNGIQLLQQLPKPLNFEVVFVTAHDEHAVKAFRLSALDYLLKPIDKDLLIEAVNRFINRRIKIPNPDQLELFFSNIYNPKVKNDRIYLPIDGGFELVMFKDLLYLEADNNYTDFYFSNGQSKITISKTMGFFEDKLNEDTFIKCSRKHIINRNFIKRYFKKAAAYVILNNGKEISVADSCKEDFRSLTNGNSES